MQIIIYKYPSLVEKLHTLIESKIYPMHVVFYEVSV
jgi:hypothetical protein